MCPRLLKIIVRAGPRCSLELKRKLDLPIYFAPPYPSWERGTNENTNGLLRQYLPKSADLSQVSPEQLRAIVHALNRRPRKSVKKNKPGKQ